MLQRNFRAPSCIALGCAQALTLGYVNLKNCRSKTPVAGTREEYRVQDFGLPFTPLETLSPRSCVAKGKSRFIGNPGNVLRQQKCP